MAARIEDYGLIGDLQSAALVDRDGSIDWLSFPRFDSGACFAALLGTEEHGRWRIAPAGEVRERRRRYRGDTLILETELETDEGCIRLIDFMPPRGRAPDLVRVVEGVRGRVPVRLDLSVRFDYGSIVPWVRRVEEAWIAIAGPDALCLRTPVELEGENMHTVAEFAVSEGERIPFVLTWFPSAEPLPEEIDPEQALEETVGFWKEFVDNCVYEGEWWEPVHRSLIVLKALTYSPTGGIVAAPTTSLPEQLGGVRNWDYRFCWLRDATLTLYALVNAGYTEEARCWRDWLHRAAAGEPADLQIMYGVAGERRLTEWEVDWLPGYAGSKPVRVGNAASEQVQLDVYGEVMDALELAREHGLDSEEGAWSLQRALLEFLETVWAKPDAGIWEVRGPQRHFTHSKVMAWVAFDRAVKAVEGAGLDGPVERWREIRDEIHAQVCKEAYDVERRTFTQYYGSQELDASVLQIPLVGFLPADDERVRGTVAAIERELCRGGFVYRYTTDESAEAVDGLPPGEGAFLPCTFWLADNLALAGRLDEARAIFERLLGLCNDLGLLAEEYDPERGCQLGNFPQAFTHVALVNTAYNLSRLGGPAHHRSARTGED